MAKKKATSSKGKKYIGFLVESRTVDGEQSVVVKATWLCPTKEPDEWHRYTSALGKGIVVEPKQIPVGKVERREGETAADAESRVNTEQVEAQRAADAEAVRATAAAQRAVVDQVVDTDAFRQVWAAIQAATEEDAQRVAKQFG